MTPQEIHRMITELAAEVGPKARASLDVNSGKSADRPIVGFLRPAGYTCDTSFVAYSDTWEGAIADLRAQWAAYAEQHAAQMVEKLALEIIHLTALHGECTDAALRGSGFDAANVARYGHDACTRADEMASSGPFSITALRGANAA